MSARNPNCYPQCTDEKIVEKLLELNPCIDITIMNMGLLLESEKGNVTGEKLLQLINLFKDRNYGGTGNSENIEFLQNVYGFYSMMSGSVDGEPYKDIPIFSSPNIQVQHGSGYRNEQSLYTFIQNVWSGSEFKNFIDKSGWGNIVSGIGSSLVKISEFAGISPRLSPYFSFQDNPFGNNAQFTAEIKLINDSEDAAQYNNVFLNTVVKNTLVRSSTGEGAWSSWLPPKLFHVSLKFGKGGKIIKKFNFCKLSSDIQPVGLMRYSEGGTKFPDAYNVRLSFTSTFPETVQTWEGEFQ